MSARILRTSANKDQQKTQEMFMGVFINKSTGGGGSPHLGDGS